MGMYDDGLLQLCSDYAAIAHMGQFRKDKQTPYISHPGRVAYLTGILGRLGILPTCAAWLHDVMEDCLTNPANSPFNICNHRTRYRDIRLFLLDNPEIRKFDGQKILQMVTELTMSQDTTISKKIRKEIYLDGIANGSVEASIIKYCDRIDNLTTCHLFSQQGFKWYIEDTQMLIDKLSDRVKAVNMEIHLILERKLETIKKTYREMYK